MTDLPILRDLGAILVASTLFVLVARLVRMPAIVAYMLAGLALGPLAGVIEISATVDLLSHFGIALLLFVVGLELSLDRIRDVGRVAVVAGLGQVAFTAAGGWAVSMLLGYSAIEAVFIGTALTFSSTVVVVKLLDEKNELHSLYGRIAVGIFLVQDLVVIVMLTLLAGLAGAEGAGADGGRIAISLLRAFGGMALLLVVALLAARWVLPPVFRWLSDTLEALFIFSLCWCLAFVLGAEALDLSLEIGAFLAGISLAQLPYSHELRRRTHPLMSFCIAVFFVTLGVQMRVDAAVGTALTAAVLSLFVLIGNPLIFLWIIARLGYGERTAFLTSVTVAQISEFSFVFAALGLSAGVIGVEVLSVIGLVGLVTIGVSSYMILYNGELYEWARRAGLLRVFRARAEDAGEAGGPRSGHVIVVGMNALGRRAIAALLQRGAHVLAVDTDPAKLAGLPCETLLGNMGHLPVLDEAGVRGAKLVLSALQIEDANRLLAWRCRALGIPVAIHAFDQAVVRDLEDLGVDYVVNTKSEALRVLAAELAHAGVLD